MICKEIFAKKKLGLLKNMTSKAFLLTLKRNILYITHWLKKCFT